MKRPSEDELQREAMDRAMREMVEALKRFSTQNPARTIRSLTRPEALIVAINTVCGWIDARHEQTEKLKALGILDPFTMDLRDPGAPFDDSLDVLG